MKFYKIIASIFLFAFPFYANALCIMESTWYDFDSSSDSFIIYDENGFDIIGPVWGTNKINIDLTIDVPSYQWSLSWQNLVAEWENLDPTTWTIIPNTSDESIKMYWSCDSKEPQTVMTEENLREIQVLDVVAAFIIGLITCLIFIFKVIK